VGLKDETGAFQKMSSRAGTVVLIDDVIDVVKATIKARFETEGKHDADTQEKLAEKLALAAVKFAFLKSDRNQSLSFDVEQSVDIHGDSGMYVMYAYVRTQSILRKAGATPQEYFHFSSRSAPEKLGRAAGQPDTATTLGLEATLVRTLLYYPEVIKKAVVDLSVHHVAQYLLELSSEFNSWYAQEIILDGSEREAYKLAVVDAVAVTLKNGLALLGIETVDEI